MMKTNEGEEVEQDKKNSLGKRKREEDDELRRFKIKGASSNGATRNLRNAVTDSDGGWCRLFPSFLLLVNKQSQTVARPLLP